VEETNMTWIGFTLLVVVILIVVLDWSIGSALLVGLGVFISPILMYIGAIAVFIVIGLLAALFSS
tara:strand:- start:197 stop:391 length:195 start_codon:yes stop_codon:yes gene_type:complete